jgi:hypothetical protein
MSRLDSFIRRVTAQRDCLNWAGQAIRPIAGVVLEIGLGNGRTFDHLREILSEREIFVIERSPKPHPYCMPDEDHLLTGDLRDILQKRSGEFKNGVALVHSDIGTGDEEYGRVMANDLSRLLPPLMADDGIVVSDQALQHPSLTPISPPAGIPQNRYFIYRYQEDRPK